MRSLVLVLVVIAALSGCGAAPARERPSSAAVRSTSASPVGHVRSSVSPTPATSPTSTSSTPRRPVDPPARLRGPRTPGGKLWGVDSTTPMSRASLANVRSWYRGGHVPAVWGRYLTGSHRVSAAELRFARRHGIAVYLIVPDGNCSLCAGGGDYCGNDVTATQARTDAVATLRAARRLRVPHGTMIMKDVEQVGLCTGELTAGFLLSWYRVVKAAGYRVGIYGNAYRQSYDFPIAYCAAVRRHPRFGRDVLLADDEPEPAISAPRGTIGPRNAPGFHPRKPSCARSDATVIWQYGESTTGENVTDVDEIRAGTPGLLLPTGAIS